MTQAHDHEVVSIYQFSEDEIDRLMTLARECVLNWTTKDGWAVGVMHSFVWIDGHAWLTFSNHRHRAAAIRRDPRVSIVVSSSASSFSDCPQGAATMKGRAVFHDDKETKEWMYRKLSQKVSPDSKIGEDEFFELLDSPIRTVIEVTPEKWITFNSAKSAADRRGELADEDKSQMASGDAERMPAEYEKRGLGARG